MPYLLGLLDNSCEQGHVENTLNSMTKNLNSARNTSSRDHMLALPLGGIAGSKGVHLHEAEHRILTAIYGNPHWTDPELAMLASSKGHAAALSSAYKRHGVDLLDYLRGPFSLAVTEPEKNFALLAIDRIGIESMSWSQYKAGFAFSNRPDILSNHPSVGTSLDTQGLFHYFYFDMVPSPNSIFSGVSKLLPGERLVFKDKRITKDFYWHLAYTENRRPKPKLESELDQLLRQSVKNSLDNRSAGAFLSGGLDSSTVTGYFSQISNDPVDVFGIGFDAEGYDEMEYARATAEHFGAKLHEYYVTPSDVATALPKIAAAYDEPFGNASAIPAYYCALLAKEHGKEYLLAGDGGDEIFAGNDRYAKQKIFSFYDSIPNTIKELVLEPLAFKLPGSHHIPPLRKLNSYISQARLPLPERMETYNFLQRTPLAEIFNEDFLQSVDPEAPLSNLREVYDRADTTSFVKRMLYMDLKITIADNDLKKVNRTSELAGIEVRYPMLDEALVEFAANVPADLLLSGLKLRFFYRKALRNFLSPKTLNKRKHGFGLPFGVWMKQDKNLNDLALGSLEAFRQENVLSPAYIDKILHAHKTEHADYYGVMIWRIMMLEQWLESHRH